MRAKSKRTLAGLFSTQPQAPLSTAAWGTNPPLLRRSTFVSTVFLNPMHPPQLRRSTCVGHPCTPMCHLTTEKDMEEQMKRAEAKESKIVRLLRGATTAGPLPQASCGFELAM